MNILNKNRSVFFLNYSNREYTITKKSQRGICFIGKAGGFEEALREICLAAKKPLRTMPDVIIKFDGQCMEYMEEAGKTNNDYEEER